MLARMPRESATITRRSSNRRAFFIAELTSANSAFAIQQYSLLIQGRKNSIDQNVSIMQAVFLNFQYLGILLIHDLRRMLWFTLLAIWVTIENRLAKL
jgi:hypothetical protein